MEWRSFGSEAELTDEYQKSSIAIIPYTGYAGYFPAAYAMGNAVPIVATDIMGHAEYVRDVGVLIRPASSEELASAVSRMLDDGALREELGAKGRKRAEDSLSWEAVARQTLAVYRA